MTESWANRDDFVLSHDVIFRIALVLDAQVVRETAVAVEAVSAVRHQPEGRLEHDLCTLSEPVIIRIVPSPHRAGPRRADS